MAGTRRHSLGIIDYAFDSAFIFIAVPFFCIATAIASKHYHHHLAVPNKHTLCSIQKGNNNTVV
jgi:hypothetical protein